MTEGSIWKHVEHDRMWICYSSAPGVCYKLPYSVKTAAATLAVAVAVIPAGSDGVRIITIAASASAYQSIMQSDCPARPRSTLRQCRRLTTFRIVFLYRSRSFTQVTTQFHST